MRILFLSGGRREPALRHLLEHGEEVMAVVTPVLTDRNRRFEGVILAAAAFGVPVYTVTRETFAATVAGLSFELLVSCGFPWTIGPEVIARARHAINVHPSLLPRYRGYRSGPYVLLNGERESGVTVHFLGAHVDAGDIILQRAFPLSPFDTTRSLSRKCRELEPELLLEAVRLLAAGQARGVPQEESRATTFDHLRTPEDSRVDPSRPLTELYDQIRAADPEDYPAFFTVAGEKVCIRLWRPGKPPGEEDMI